MTNSKTIADHWGTGDFYGLIVSALNKMSKPLDSLTVEDLAPVDHFHARGFPATVELADRLPIGAGQHILDIGCGLGGPARYMARRFQCRVTGLDITEPFVDPSGQPLLGYAQRSGPDDFASLTGFLESHPKSPWRAALLTDLGLEYYNTAYYSRALEAWQAAWALGQKATDTKGKFLADRAVCELAGLYSRLGRMTELEALLKSVEKRGFIGGATERINLAWEALSMMQNQPGISFRCEPLALKSILRSNDKLRISCSTNAMMEIFNSASTQKRVSRCRRWPNCRRRSG